MEILETEIRKDRGKYETPKIHVVSFVFERGFGVSTHELDAVSFVATVNSGESFWEGNGEEGVVAGVFDSTSFSW